MAQETPKPKPFVDPVLHEQFEIQMRSQYRWQANNTWLYFPFMALFAAVCSCGVFLLGSTFFGNDVVFALFGGTIATIVGGLGTWSMWTGYQTAREMAIRLKQAESK